MTTIGFIGSGNIGGTVARLSVAAGHNVVLSNSRGPDTLKELADELGPLARAGTGEQAAQAGDIVVVTIPLKAYLSVPAEPLAGKVVIDTMNYYPQRDGQIADLDTGSATSSGLLQRHLPDSAVVKAFNNIFFRHMQSLARPAGAPDRTFLPIAGDDPQAKASVTAFLDSIGFGTVDAGTLADSWRQEPGSPAYGSPYGSFSDPAGTPADAAKVTAALAQAERSLLSRTSRSAWLRTSRLGTSRLVTLRLGSRAYPFRGPSLGGQDLSRCAETGLWSPGPWRDGRPGC